MKAKFVEKEVSIKDMCVCLGLSKTSLLSKMNGRTQFKLNEVRRIIDELDLTQAEVKEIFFD